MSDQAARLRHLVKQQQQEFKGRNIAILSGKGGVGKSNVALNFALSLIEQKKKVLVIDMDIGMGNIHVLLGETLQQSMIQCITENQPLQNSIHKVENGLHFMSSGSSFSKIFTFSDTQFQSFFHEVEGIITNYDFVIWDMGAGFSNETLQIVNFVEEILIVTTPEPTAVTDAYAVIKYLTNYENSSRLYLIVNKCKNPKQGLEVGQRFILAVNRFLNKEVQQLGSLIFDQRFQQAAYDHENFLFYEKGGKNPRLLEEIVLKFLSKNIESKKNSLFVQQLKSYFLRGRGLREKN